MKSESDKQAKPFLKWAGGKSQLLDRIVPGFPFDNQAQFTYIEPFVGGGAVLFWVLEKFPKIKKAVINDINTDLMNCYKTIKNDVNGLIGILLDLQNEFYGFNDNEVRKKEYYYNKRDFFNSRKSDQTGQSALFIFLNRTCYNGLYRVNSNNLYNVPMGSYKKPLICDSANLKLVNNALKNTEILNLDFEKTLDYACDKPFFYFDPPYKPLSKTSNFNTYAKYGFGDKEQLRLKEFCDKIDKLGHCWMLSNSDVKGTDPENEFFDILYKQYQIKRVPAKRFINSNPEKRGLLTELLITNYTYPNSTL